MANSSRAQDYLMQIVTAGYGFDVPEIQNALLKTNYQSVEAAVEYLFANQGKAATSATTTTSSSSSSSNTTQSNKKKRDSVSSKDIQELKDRISKLEIQGNFKLSVTTDIMNNAIKQNPNRPDDALNYIMDKYSHLIKPNDDINVTSKKDAEALKQKLIDDAIKKKAEQEREAREREKQIEMDRKRALQEEKEKEASRIRHKQRIEANRKKIADKKHAKKIKAQKSTLEWHKRHEQYDKNDIERLQKIERNRMKQTQSIDSPDKALQTLFERYGEDDARETISMIIKIVSNILKHPEQEKYRKINLSNNKIKALIVTPLGALKFFEFLGFEQVIEKDKIFPNDILKQKKYLIYKNFNENDCRQAILMLNKYIEINKTIVYEYYDQIINGEDDKKISDNISNDDLYMAFMYLYTMINNILISPDSAHLRLVEIDNEIFKKRVGNFKIFQKLLKKLGYKLEDRIKGKVLVLRWKESEKQQTLKYLKNVCRDLYTIAHDEILMTTTIGTGIKKIYQHNTTNLNDLYKYFNTLIKAIDRILNEPLNMKYQSLNVDKLKQKYSNITGVVSVLKLLGFRKNKDDKTKFILSAEYNRDLELLKWRKTIFSNVINDKKLLSKK